jgi:hypothetical protein
MSDEQSPSPNTGGQADAAPWAQGTTAAAPQSQEGQATAPIQSQDQGQAPTGTPATDEPTFFDVNNLPPELLVPYKQMQGAFTTKTQEIARQKQKIEAYDAFMRDPVGQIQALAGQYGMQLTRAQAQQVQQAQQQQDQQGEWTPQTWDEVIKRTKDETRQELMRDLAPYLGQVQQIQAGNIEKQLTTIDPEWRTYEGNMRELLQKHPSLVNDVSVLYRMAVPPETLEAKAIQQALKKFEDKGKHTAVSHGGSAPRSKPAAPQITTFEEAYQAAKQKLMSGE